MANNHGVKLGNEYLRLYEKGVFSKTPKAVFAAIAASYANRLCEENQKEVNGEVIREWWALYENGIVPQKPMFPRPDIK